jgi:hypothetical protein
VTERFVVDQIKCVGREPAVIADAVAPRDQARIIELLVDRVNCDADAGSVAITFRPSGIKSLAKLIEEEAA